jgi:hypothetical protein
MCLIDEAENGLFLLPGGNGLLLGRFHDITEACRATVTAFVGMSQFGIAIDDALSIGILGELRPMLPISEDLLLLLQSLLKIR